jgi:hypothetical protein
VRVSLFGGPAELASRRGLSCQYDRGMATRLRLAPDLAGVVERARRRALEAGESSPKVGGQLTSRRTSPLVAAAIGELLRDRTYAEAVGRVAAEDPDLADQ